MTIGKEQVQISIIIQVKQARGPAYYGPGEFVHHRGIKVVDKYCIAQASVIAAFIINKKCQGVHFGSKICIDQVCQPVFVNIS